MTDDSLEDAMDTPSSVGELRGRQIIRRQAEALFIPRSEAVRRLVELGLKAKGKS